jgi:hypothetical protein
MDARIATIRQRMQYRGEGPADHIGCILIVNPIFFREEDWIPQPSDWPPRNLTPMRYDLSKGEDKRLVACAGARKASSPEIGGGAALRKPTNHQTQARTKAPFAFQLLMRMAALVR